MTRRERLERKLELRTEWAEKRHAKASAVFHEAEKYRGDHAFNTQPGHIPERARLIRREDRAIEDIQMAEHHENKAAGLERQLERTVFSDDEDAIQDLEARIAKREAEVGTRKAINDAWRRAKGDLEKFIQASGMSRGVAETVRETMHQCPWLKSPMDTTSLRAAIRRDKERIEELKRRAKRTARAEAGGGIIIEGGEWVQITFAEKPAREILEALKAAGFQWGAGYWCGCRDKIPAIVISTQKGQEDDHHGT